MYVRFYYKLIRPFYKDHGRSSLIDMTVCMVLDQKVQDNSNVYIQLPMIKHILVQSCSEFVVYT